MKLMSDSPGETRQIGKILAKNLEGNDIILLFGELGSGKTVFTRGIAMGLGIKKDLVISPSFVIIRKYTGEGLSLNHFDLYRLQKTDDILALGYEEYFYDQAVTVVEWAQRLKGLLPKEHLKIEFFITGNTQRVLKITAQGRHYRALLERMQKAFN
jgi:tRNA threonylcarbamoyladenosine biosynthesis protein TsaE